MVFGTFDGVHEGHRTFFGEARRHGDYLVAVVAQDHIVQYLKGYLPEINLAERFENIKKEDGVDEVIVGDMEIGTWEVVKKYKPDVIAIGYDQHALRENLENHIKDLGYKPEIEVMHAYEPNKLHSSRFNL